MLRAREKALQGLFDIHVEREFGLFLIHALTDEGAAWLTLVEADRRGTEALVVSHKHAWLLCLAAQNAGLSVY